MKVLGMGNALVDALVKIKDDSVIEKLGLTKGLMTLIDETKFQELSKMLNKLDKSIVSGGSASNTIVGLAALGVETGFLGRIGNDVYGKLYKQDLEKHNVKPHLIEAAEVSGVASTFISEDGERTFGTYLGAAAKLSADDLCIADFKGYDCFYIEGYLVQSHQLIERALEIAKSLGMKIAIDLASANVVEENLAFLERVIPQYVDIIFANEEEAKALTGLEPEQAVTKMKELADLVIVKTGAKGSWVQQSLEKVSVPAFEANCVDTTGAGDLYAAGFLYGLSLNKEITICARMGSLLAAEVIQNIGPKVLDNRWGFIKKKMSEF